MMRMPGGARGRRLTEPQRAWPVRGVRIRKPAQDADGRRGLVQVTHASDHVQDWLGCQAGDGSGADVMNAATEPGSEHLFQDGLLGLKSPGPSRVVRRDMHAHAPDRDTVLAQAPGSAARRLARTARGRA